MSGNSPLSGLKVLDFTWAAAGPVVTTFLCFLGADIVKVEHRSRPDLMRVSDRQYGYGNERGINDSPLFNELAADKRSIELDLNLADDLALVKRLAREADVLVENMRPGKFAKFGMSYEELSAENPGLIMCSVSATGRLSVEGPPGYAPIFWAEGGGAWMTGWPDRNPGLVRGPVDLHAAAFATVGVMALLRQRRQTGRGGCIDCSAIETVAATVGAHLLETQCGLGRPTRSGNAGGGYLVNDVFPVRGDDRWIAISLLDEADIATFVAVMNRNFEARLESSAVMAANGWDRVAAITAPLDGISLAQALRDAGLAAAYSMSMLEALNDAGLLQRCSLQPIQHDTIGEQVIIGLPWMVDGQPYEITGPAPKLGENRAAILQDWLEEMA